MAKKEFTHNEATALMDRNAAHCIRLIRDHIKKREYSKDEIISLMDDMADALDIAAIDADMKDSVGYRVEERGKEGTFLINKKPGCR